MHLKINELISSHEHASNTVIHAGKKNEKEITELSKEYSDLPEEIIEKDNSKQII